MMRPVIIFVLFCSFLPSDNFATHLRAGEITAERISCLSLTFIITITVFLDTESGVTFGGADDWLDFGDGVRILVKEQTTVPRPDLGRNMGMVTVSFEHTYSGYQQYTITYSEPNRNDFIVNMDRSVRTRFFLETVIYLDPSLSCNQNLPDLLIPPIDRACSGVAFFHNPGAYDLDGDSLSFEIATPQRDLNTAVFNYIDPSDEKFYTNYETGNEARTGRPEFFINATDGTLEWDAPGLIGEYNIAFRIIEWRKDQEGVWYKMSYVTRDMQIIVEDCDNKRPDLIVPNDTCIVAGTILEKTVFGIDPENDMVKIEAFSEVFNLLVSPATYTPSPPSFQASFPPAQLHFRWNTECAHVKDQVYQIVFKVTDKPLNGPQLVTFRTWRIKVIGPPPQWNDIRTDSRSALLQWDDYVCENADRMQIWRKIDGSAHAPSECETGMPNYLGYSLIATLNQETTVGNSFADNNQGNGLAPGARYCYRLVAIFREPSGGESYVSKDTCITIAADAPVITHVTVEETHPTSGAIRISWRSPFALDRAQYPGPYEYEVYRATGFANEDAVLATPTRIRDTTFVDLNINTEDKAFNYKIVLYANTVSEPLSWNATDTSATASSVRLETISSDKSITLRWKAEVPWSNRSDQFPFHLIYRKNENDLEDNFILIDRVDVRASGFEYVDHGQYNNIPLGEGEYCYKVETRGVYGNPLIQEPLENLSQVMCSSLNDHANPCIPVMAIEHADCSAVYASQCVVNDFSNRISWRARCSGKLKSYRIYAASAPDREFELIADNVTDTLYVDRNLSSFSRCYKVSAIDNQGNESEWSEMVCNDNCPYFELPNVFSPNGDKCNDYFSAYGPFNPLNQDASESCVLGNDNFSKCLRFVKDVSFQVFNRWGKEVYTYKSGVGENSIYINWDGRNNDGQWLASGVYYYSASVTFETLEPFRNRSYKGYVHILR